MDIKEKILTYIIDYDPESLSSVLDSFNPEESANGIMELLKSPSPDYIELTTFARDVYFSNQIPKIQKEEYYQCLVDSGFFQELDKCLYAADYTLCSWTIYIIGKFSHHENAILLERAYESSAIQNNPILAYRALSEMRWLGSPKVNAYIKKIGKVNSLISALTLFYYYDCVSEKKSVLKKSLFFKTLFINQNTPDVNARKQLILFELECFKHFEERDYRTTTRKEFEEFAQGYLNRRS